MGRETRERKQNVHNTIRPFPTFRIILVVDLVISMFFPVLTFYSHLWYIIEIVSVMGAYTAGAVHDFIGYARKQNHRRKFVRFYVRGMMAVLPALLVLTVAFLFQFHIIKGIREWLMVLFVLTNILFAFSILFPFIRQVRIVKGKVRTLIKAPEKTMITLKMRLKAAGCREPLIYVRNLGGRKIANASQIGITRPVIIMTDFLYENMMESHLAAIIGHEMGHFANRDAFRSMLMFTLPVFLDLDLLFYALIKFTVTSSILLGVFALFCAGIDLAFIFPWSRKRSEIQADRFVGEKLGMAEGMAWALETLIIMNGRPPEYRFFSSRTHPSIDQRILLLRKNFDLKH
ncbi:M48 family metalloprotease [Oxyplasma meridianum]|uniref:M48 family metalloprotease n=1 Tax=Oxyplasma meridianum TaxID=3073602 RepID=A0AAX4NFX3_9ARCH